MFKTSNKTYWESWIEEIKQPNTAAKAKVTYPIQRERHSAQYNLGEPFSYTYFTQREADCVFHLLQGKTMTEIGQILKLSPRTVEYYLTNIKKKLNCRKKNELIDKVLTTQFLDSYKP